MLTQAQNNLRTRLLVVMTGLLLLTAWLGARKLNADPIWMDERFSLIDAGGGIYGPRTLDQIWTGVAQRNPWHVPGYFMLINQWGTLTGWDPATVRALSLLFGLLAVAWTYRLGRDTFTPQVGVLAASLLGTSVMFVHYLHEIRHYALIACLTATIFWVYLRLVRTRQPGVGLWLGFGLAAVGLLYTHYFAVFPLVAIGIHHLLFIRKDQRWWQIVGVLTLAGALFLPWVRVLLSGLRLASNHETLHSRALSNAEILSDLLTLLGNGVLPLVFVTLILSSVALVRDRTHTVRMSQMWLFAASLLIPPLAINAVLPIMPETRIRYLIGFFVPFALVLAFGINWLWQRQRGLTLLLMLIWVGTGIYGAMDWRVTRSLGGGNIIYPEQAIWHTLRDVYLPRDLLINFIPDDDAINHYSAEAAHYYYSSLALDYWYVLNEPPGNTQFESQHVPPRFLDSQQRMWVAHMPNQVTSEFTVFVPQLEQTHVLCEVRLDRPDMYLALYARYPLCCGTRDRIPVVATYGTGIQLRGVQGLDVTTRDDTLSVVTSWSLDASVPLHVYSLSLQVVNAAGVKVAQADQGISPQPFHCAPSAIDMQTLAPGDYRVLASVYAWQTGERLPGVWLANDTHSDQLDIGGFTRADD